MVKHVNSFIAYLKFCTTLYFKKDDMPTVRMIISAIAGQHNIIIFEKKGNRSIFTQNNFYFQYCNFQGLT